MSYIMITSFFWKPYNFLHSLHSLTKWETNSSAVGSGSDAQRGLAEDPRHTQWLAHPVKIWRIICVKAKKARQITLMKIYYYLNTSLFHSRWWMHQNLHFDFSSTYTIPACPTYSEVCPSSDFKTTSITLFTDIIITNSLSFYSPYYLIHLLHFLGD